MHTTHALYGNPNGDYIIVTLHSNFHAHIEPTGMTHLGAPLQALRALAEHLAAHYLRQRREARATWRATRPDDPAQLDAWLDQKPRSTRGPQAQLAAILGVSQQTTSRYLDGSISPPATANWTAFVRAWHAHKITTLECDKTAGGTRTGR